MPLRIIKDENNFFSLPLLAIGGNLKQFIAHQVSNDCPYVVPIPNTRDFFKQMVTSIHRLQSLVI